MAPLMLYDWLVIGGLGAAWLGGLIVWAGNLPRQLRRGEAPTAEKGTPQAFALFWLDQYGYLGLTLLVGGLLATAIGALS